ncbi:hypothetical protein ABIC66_002463 [Caulobacter sp. 1776]
MAAWRLGGLAGKDSKFCIDERLREKEFGVLDRLTRVGIEARFPEHAEFRRLLDNRSWNVWLG